ncbi:MAG: glycoside hydrolase family 99-like domain-containing protein, partial [Clostridia bacterium]|nr:glycoside hydrolase family 99-like domain-containing protein [Clostridia bacterium]
MYNIKLTSYVPEPKPVTTDRIVTAHYYAAWKKGAAELHNGFDDLHDYPERTPLMGYYDEESPEVCDWEIKWAIEHGINCFIHCWYRRKYNEGKPVTADALRCGHGLHEALFNAKYQKYMKFAIMFENSPRWGNTDSRDLIENLMPFWMETYFKRENYLVIDNKPVLFVYYQPELTRVWPNPADQKAAFDACREYAKGCGFDGMIFAVEWRGMFSEEAVADSLARGYDFRFGYTGYRPPNGVNMPEQDYVLEQSLERAKFVLNASAMHHIATASCFWDPEPRTTQHWLDLGSKFAEYGGFFYAQPETYRKILRGIKEMCDALPDGAWAKKIIMIDNWNEWDEGHYVSPSHEFGFRYLQAIREELTARDNLPDYRMPQDLGLSENLNKSWGEPDLGPICKQKLEEK